MSSKFGLVVYVRPRVRMTYGKLNLSSVPVLVGTGVGGPQGMYAVGGMKQNKGPLTLTLKLIQQTLM